MKNFILFTAFGIAALTSNAQCAQNVCENTAVGIEVNYTAIAGESYDFVWTISAPFVGQGTDSIAVSNVGPAPATISYSVQVTNLTTGCVSDYACTLTVIDAVPYVLNIPPLCSNASPIDISSYVSPSGAILSGPALSGTMYDPSIGGLVTATPPAGSGCLAASTQDPTILNPPVISGFTITQ